jgi:hypothetical protein
MKFRLEASEHQLCIRGIDDEGNPFCCTLDRVWAMNLAAEVDDWLANGIAERYEPPRIVPCSACSATGLVDGDVCPLCAGQAIRRA